jgi:hypothetical protein
METAGLVLGVLTLAGTFKDCIDLFSYFSAYKKVGRDYEILEAKLDVEKTLLLQWAQRTRLAHPDYDRRLEDAGVQQAVYRILSSICLLLSESTSLQERYGLKPLPPDMDTVGPLATTVSRGHLEKFTQDFRILQLHKDPKQLGIFRLNKVRWAISDSSQFEKLVQDLSHFVAKLNQLVPDSNHEWEGTSGKALLVEVLAELQDFATVRNIRAATVDAPKHVAAPAQARFEEILQPKILERLWFRTMDARLEAISPAHCRTFAWALDSNSALSSWLESDSEMFWLSGKAGSGKSTLMKYLYGQKQTKNLLCNWAGTSKLVLGSFFFWNLGASDQKSHTGLSRSVLYQILMQNPSLLPILLPRMWKEACNYESDEDTLAGLEAPSSVELATAFRSLQGVSMEEKYCFFIDGLDEYEGDLHQGIDFVRSLCKHPSIKVLLSSRPIPLCTDSFLAFPTLRLQDVIRTDIQGYVQETLGSHHYMISLSESNPIDAAAILQQLVDKSAGVFLWVILACRSLLNGFAAYDTAVELQSRVDELPPELEGMFRHMLCMVEPRYFEHTAKMLRVCYQRQVTYRSQDYFRQTSLDVDAICWDILDRAGMDFENVPPFDIAPNDKWTVWNRVERRLRSRCGGLLELKLPENLSSSRQTVLSTDATVVFMHRTVFEFLDNPGTWNLDHLRIHDPRFNANAALSLMSTHLWYWQRKSIWYYAMADALLCARLSDEENPEVSFPLLERMMLVVLNEEADTTKLQDSKLSSKLIGQYGRDTFILLLAVEANMVKYVTNNIKQHKLQTLPYPFLYHALAKVLLDISSPLQPDTKSMVQFLLSVGCEPNEEFAYEDGRLTSPWRYWVSHLRAMPHDELFRSLGITETLITAGAHCDEDKFLRQFLCAHIESARKLTHFKPNANFRTGLRVVKL